MALADDVEQRLHGLHGLLGPAGNERQFAGRREIGASQYRAGHEGLAGFLVELAGTIDGRNAMGPHRHVNAVCRHAIEQSAVAGQYGIEDRVGRQHRNDDVAAGAGVGGRIGRFGTLCDQRVRLSGRRVEYSQLMAVAEHPASHALAHASETYKTYFHMSVLVETSAFDQNPGRDFIVFPQQLDSEVGIPVEYRVLQRLMLFQLVHTAILDDLGEISVAIRALV